MTHPPTSLEPFDVLELLYLLSGQERSGALVIERRSGRFQLCLRGGRVQHIQFGDDLGVPALERLLLDPVGRFHFEEGVVHTGSDMDATLDEVVYQALDALPLDTLPFTGPARLTSPERVSRGRWSLSEHETLRQIEAQVPLSGLAREPHALRLLVKLHRMGLITSRKSRVARLTVTVTRQVRDVALIDALILKRWKEDLVREPQYIAVRTAGGQVHSLPVRVGLNLTTQLLVPPELLMRTALRAGDSVLVRPV